MKLISKNKQLLFALGVSVLGMIPFSGEAQAQSEQCVYSQTGIGFVANVRWYRRNDITHTRDNSGKVLVHRDNPNVRPFKDENVPVWQYSCTNDTNAVAVVSVVGGEIAANAARVALSVVGAAACVGSAGYACPAAAVAVTGMGGTAIPNAKEVFYVGIPREEKGGGTGISVAGSVWKPWFVPYK